MENKQFELRLYRLPDVCGFTGLRKSSIYAMIKDGSFPAPVRIGRRAVAWRQEDIGRWIDARRSADAGSHALTGVCK
ncbi:helix-turn-helix transcriptional regulator [Burkholderia diffusa]|uniref:helix-turn-helix transcriptional regulator n=1 Tax=Burkholderia diffusa TaxID=488732 RepID=UPI0009BD3895|nr:AlpA family phage regulatory protein [Burkholderia diffusa]